MEFYIGSQFSREFSFEESRVTQKLAEELNLFFKDKDYGERIKNIVVGIICVSKDFEPFFPVRRTKVMRKEPTISYEIKLDFESFKSSNVDERKLLLVKEFFKKTKEYLTEITIKDFKKDEFINDLEIYFKNISN
ncbi:Immunity protein 44 [Flaviramulus basaltis]|uniref:Immunity protein 44 n=1 Tax=Flaviramulus basaltis TaxID=369401 RepID=A0A1K2INX3_9FLAO|nr:Imm44 family immunity protein [Flaviramulus basaltis]SFZ93395.1 Immunity protein 44 [Flaviramulus basaltis]